MLESPNCSNCGVAILATTAEETGGLCMPCKKGTRASMELARMWNSVAQDPESKEAIDHLVKGASQGSLSAHFLQDYFVSGIRLLGPLVIVAIVSCRIFQVIHWSWLHVLLSTFGIGYLVYRR